MNKLPEKKQPSVLTDTTRFVNTHKDKYVIYIDGKPVRTILSGESQVMPLFVAQIGAEHLAKKIMQEKEIRAVTLPTPVRDKIMAEILPDITEEEKIVVLTEEKYREKTDEMLKKQEKAIASLGGKDSDKDDRILKLEEEIKKLKSKKVVKKQ